MKRPVSSQRSRKRLIYQHLARCDLLTLVVDLSPMEDQCMVTLFALGKVVLMVEVLYWKFHKVTLLELLYLTSQAIVK